MSHGFPNHHEAKPFVEASGWVDLENLQFDGNTSVVGLAAQGSNQLRPDPSVLVVWRDLHDGDKDAALSPLNRDAPDGHSVALNDLTCGKIKAVAKVLGLPLFVPTPRLLHVGPHGGAVQPPQKVVILVSCGPE